MVDDVSYSLVTTSSTTYLSGLSGFDSSALIEASVQAELAPAYDLEIDIEENNEVVTAYEEMQSYLGSIENTLDSLRNEPGTLGEPTVFEERQAYLSVDDGSTASNYLGISVDEETAPGSYSIEIEQIATAQKIGSDTQSSSDTALGLDGVFTLATDDLSSDITVTADMTLEDVKDEINNSSGETGVSASILQISDSEYMLVLSATETGQDITLSSVSGDDIGDSLGLTNAGVVKNELQEAKDAIITVDGVTITRSSNSIDDAIDGVTLDLYGANEGATFTVEIDYDYSSTKTALLDLVEAYNAYREFALIHQDIDSAGNIADTAVLYGDDNLQAANNIFFDALGQTMEIDGETYSLGNLGFSLDDDNYLEYDEDTLDDFLLENIEVVQKMFEFQATSDSENLMVLSHDKSLTSGTYTFDFEVDADGEITSVSVDGDDSLFEINGSTIEGVSGSQFEGLSLVFAGDADETIELTIWQGLADQMYDDLNAYTDPTDGLIASAISGLEEDTEEMEGEIADIEESAASLEASLISYYAEIEAKILEAESLSSYLDAVYNSDD